MGRFFPYEIFIYLQLESDYIMANGSNSTLKEFGFILISFGFLLVLFVGGIFPTCVTYNGSQVCSTPNMQATYIGIGMLIAGLIMVLIPSGSKRTRGR